MSQRATSWGSETYHESTGYYMSTFGLTVSVREGDNNGPPIEGATVYGQLPGSPTNAEGLAPIDHVDLVVTHPAFYSYAGGYDRPSPDAVIPISLQRRPLLPDLYTRGQFFEQANGAYWTAIGCSDFALLAKYQNGEDITPVLGQRQACGFNILRVWTAFDIDGIGVFTTLDYAKVPGFVDLCARYGLYVEFTAYTGINDPQHWTYLCAAALQCRPRPLLELVNELSENTNEPDSNGHVFNLSDYARPDVSLLCSHGSNGSERVPVMPFWSYATFHTNDAFEWQRKVGHNAMEIWSGPTYSNENTRYPDKASSTQMATDAAAGAALLCAGSCFHSVEGKASGLFSPETEAAARAWTAGARSVDLRFQDGMYRHASELETTGVLRAYQRVLTSGEAATILIRV